MNIVEENEVYAGGCNSIARTSPLLECAGVFVYSEIDRMGLLAHWQNREIERSLDSELSKLSLSKPQAIIAGCGVPIECLVEDSQSYEEVREFLNNKRIPIKEQRIGLDNQVELEVNFSDGSYRIE
jgi:hypothetical protein